MLLERNRLEEARAYFATAIHYTPAAAPLKFQVDCHAGFGETFMRLKQWQDAAIEFPLSSMRIRSAWTSGGTSRKWRPIWPRLATAGKRVSVRK